MANGSGAKNCTFWTPTQAVRYFTLSIVQLFGDFAYLGDISLGDCPIDLKVAPMDSPWKMGLEKVHTITTHERPKIAVAAKM